MTLLKTRLSLSPSLVGNFHFILILSSIFIIIIFYFIDIAFLSASRQAATTMAGCCYEMELFAVNFRRRLFLSLSLLDTFFCASIFAIPFSYLFLKYSRSHATTTTILFAISLESNKHTHTRALSLSER